MTRRSDNNRRAFYVVQFLKELPVDVIDDYVCVPYTWMILRHGTNERSVVAYPHREDPFVTRDRVKNKEKINDEWRFYMTTVKYETDSYGDAEYWIELNKKLRTANRNHSSKSNDNSQKPLPRKLIKLPLLPEPNKQLDGKRIKLDDAAQSSSAVVTDTNAEPGSSRQEQSIITQDNQPKESNQTETTAALSSPQQKDPRNENIQESLPIQEHKEVNIPYINKATSDTLTHVINEEVRATSIEEQQVPSYQAISQFTEQSKPTTSVEQPQIVAAPSIDMTQNLVKKRITVMNIKSNLNIAASKLMDQTRTLSTHSVEQQSSVITRNQSHNGAQIQEMRTGNSRKSTALLQKNLKRSQIVNTVDPRNIVRSFTNVAPASQSGLNSFLQHPSYIRQLDGQQSLPNQQQSPTQSYQNQCIQTNQNNFEQDLLRKSTERNNYEPNYRNISMSTPFIGQNSIFPSYPLYQTSELPQHRQLQSSQQDSQRQPQQPKRRIRIPMRPKNNRQTPTLQVPKETLSPILTKVLNSVRQALLTNQYLLNEQQFQGNHRERELVNENHPSEIDNMLQTDVFMEEETPSAHHGANSDSDSVTDHELISDHEMSADELPTERTKNLITSQSSSADRPIAAQNSTNHQTHSKVILEQQMLDNFATLFTQMGATLRYTCDMYNTLRSSILDTVKTYKQLLGAVEEFNSAHSARSSSSLSNRTKEVSQFPKERQIEVTARTSSSTQNQHTSKNVDANRTSKKKQNSWRFVLPPEYDPRDTKWTLKYRTNLPGLVELMPQSGVYVSCGDLKYCQKVSKDCKSLAIRLLTEVFNRNALSVCLSMTERAQTSDDVGSIKRPELDDHACKVLLNFVLEHGLQHGWNTDLQPILSTLHSKIQEIRFKYGLLVQC